jgi:hypothetical protein
VCCNMLQRVRCTHDIKGEKSVAVLCNVVKCVAVCCSVLQCVAVCCSMLQRVKPTHDFFESAPFMYTADDAERSAKIVNFVMHF